MALLYPPFRDHQFSGSITVRRSIRCFICVPPSVSGGEVRRVKRYKLLWAEHAQKVKGSKRRFEIREEGVQFYKGIITIFTFRGRKCHYFRNFTIMDFLEPLQIHQLLHESLLPRLRP